MLVASGSFALMGVCIKYVVTPPDGAFAPIPVGEVVFFRSVFVMLIALAVGWRQRERLLGVAHWMLITRALAGLASMYAYFLAISWLKLGDAVLLNYLSPLLVAAMSPWVLGARAPRAVWLALAIGFAGVWVVADPAGELSRAGLIAGLASAVLAASAYLSVKVLSRTDSSITIVIWFSVIGAVLSALQLSLQGQWVTPSKEAFGALAGVGVFAGLAQIMMTMAYARSDAARVSVFAYATPIFAYVLGQAVLGEAIGWRGAIGCALLATAGLLATLLGRR